MPVIHVTSHPLTESARAELARKLTDAATVLAEVPADKVQVFFLDQTPGPVSIVVHAVAHGPDAEGWRATLHDAVGRSFTITVNLYPPDHTAKAGKLRAPSQLPDEAEGART